MDNESQELRVSITRLEERMERHRNELDQLKQRQTEQHHDMKAVVARLDTLNDTISRGQWIIIGAVGFFMLQSMGLSEFLKKLIS